MTAQTHRERIASPILGNPHPKSRLVHDLQRLADFIYAHDLPSGDITVHSESGVVTVDLSRTAWPETSLKRWANALANPVLTLARADVDGRPGAAHMASGLTGDGTHVTVRATFALLSR